MQVLELPISATPLYRDPLNPSHYSIRPFVPGQPSSAVLLPDGEPCDDCGMLECVCDMVWIPDSNLIPIDRAAVNRARLAVGR